MRRASARLYLSKIELTALADWHHREADELQDGLEDLDSPEPDEVEAIQADIGGHRERGRDLSERAYALLDEHP